MQAGFLAWLIDQLPQESWLNTHFWRWLIPQLYKKYPNMDMALAFACSGPPTVQLQTDGVTANAAAELNLLVKTDGKSVPVACISMVSSPSRNSLILFSIGVCKLTFKPPSTHLTNLMALGQTLSMDAIVNVVSNNITAEAALNDLILALKWSDIGNFPVNLFQVSVGCLLFYVGSQSNHVLWAGGYKLQSCARWSNVLHSMWKTKR